MKLVDALPREFDGGEYSETRAYKFHDVVVVKSHGYPNDYERWPGRERNVNVWHELENGYAVGWNENTSRGWSFPVIKMKGK